MKKTFPLFLLLLLSIILAACTADGEVDTDAMKGFADRIQQEVMPTKEEFRQMAEKHIAALPVDEQAEARRDLRKALDEWPTEEELDRKIDEAIEEFAKEALNRAEVEKLILEASDELPNKEQLKSLIDKLPEGEELDAKINEGMSKFFEAMDSISTELKKKNQ